MVRVGIGLYGLWPSKETFLSCRLRKRRPPSLHPVLAWKARIAQIKTVPKGAFIGYGGTYRTTRRTALAVVPVGYYDGYGRSLSNASHVLIRGRRAGVVGRVAMDFLTADVTDIPGVGLEDEAVLIGRSGKEQITVAALAALAGTIAYEIVARINPEMPRSSSEGGPMPQNRLISVDAFRGLTIAAMILVNNPGSWSFVYAPLRHAEWHGWTPTDLIFPFFLFIVGISIALSFSKRIEEGPASGTAFTPRSSDGRSRSSPSASSSTSSRGSVSRRCGSRASSRGSPSASSSGR